MSCDLVEFATAVKPLLLLRLLEEADQAVYWTLILRHRPMTELPGLSRLAGRHPPHSPFPRAPAGDADHSDGHLLLVGVNNLGFCAVDRRSRPALEWWWSHLSTECLYDPLAGLFVDQKWMDIGSSHFQAASFRHAGYNVSVANLWERPLALDEEGYRIASTGERLRLFHFHAFDSSAPEKLSLRAKDSYAHLVQDDSVLLQLCKEYASVLTSYRSGCRRHRRTPTRQIRGAGRSPANSAAPTGESANTAPPLCRCPSKLRRRTPTNGGGGGPGWSSDEVSCMKAQSVCASCCQRSTTTSSSAFHDWRKSSTTASPAGRGAGGDPADPDARALPAPPPVRAEPVDVHDLLVDPCAWR